MPEKKLERSEGANDDTKSRGVLHVPASLGETGGGGVTVVLARGGCGGDSVLGRCGRAEARERRGVAVAKRRERPGIAPVHAAVQPMNQRADAQRTGRLQRRVHRPEAPRHLAAAVIHRCSREQERVVPAFCVVASSAIWTGPQGSSLLARVYIELAV